MEKMAESNPGQWRSMSKGSGGQVTAKCGFTHAEETETSYFSSSCAKESSRSNLSKGKDLCLYLNFSLNTNPVNH